MPTIYRLKTFADLVASVREELGIQSSDSTAIARIKRDINIAYQEIASHHRWIWLRGYSTISMPAYVGGGTATATSGSTSVTLTEAPATSQYGNLFSVSGDAEIYEIAAHTAASTSLVLKTPYNGTTGSSKTYRIWQQKIPLPADCREVVEVWHNFSTQPIENYGMQDFRRLTSSAPKAEGRPTLYAVGDYVDPAPYAAISGLPSLSTRASSGLVKTLVFASTLGGTSTDTSNAYLQVGDRIRIISGGHYTYNGEFIVSSITTTTSTNDTITYTGSVAYQEPATADTSLSLTKLGTEVAEEAYKELYIYPAIYNSRTTIHVDYIKKCPDLINDSDEPALPMEDRVAIRYGALDLGWSRAGREQEASINRGKLAGKLTKMLGKLTDSHDSAILQVDPHYSKAKRTTRGASISSSPQYMASGGSGSSAPTGTASRAAQFDSTGTLAASSVTSTELGYLSGVTSAVQTQLNDITTLADGKIYVGNGSNVATEVTMSGDITMTNAAVTSITAGVIVNADVSASAALARSKLASGTAYRIVANDSGGVMGENAAITASRIVESDANGQLVASVITATELTYLDDVEALTSFSMNDNQAAAANVTTWTLASFDSIIVDYSIKRGAGNKEMGTLYLATDGTDASIARSASSIGTIGVTFSVDVSAGALRLRYTSTSTGTAPTMKYKVQKWLA